MPSEVPVTIRLVKERAAYFRRLVELLLSAVQDTPSLYQLRETQYLIEELAWQESSRVGVSSPLYTLDWALAWAHGSPPPSINALREAREALEAAASAWSDSWAALQAELNRRIKLQAPPWPDRLYQAMDLVAREKRYLELILEESWPVVGKEEEQRAVEEMKQGAGLELDDAFARIAGTTKEDWLRQVEEHKRKKRPPDEG